MSVTLGGRTLPGPHGMSPVARLALAFVDGGIEWLGWAAADQQMRYEFPDETALVEQVQLGLHASPLTLLPRLGLKVSPVKLLTMTHPDLALLARAETSPDTGAEPGSGASSAAIAASATTATSADAIQAAQLRKVFDMHGLWTQEELAAGPAWLARLGLQDQPLFLGLEFSDVVQLAELAEEVPPPLEQAAALQRLQQEAADFAHEQARTPPEFCDYYRVYLDLAADRPGDDAPARAQTATSLMRWLPPLMFSALDCPQVEPLPSPGAVEKAIGLWLSRGRQVGFARLSRAVQQVVRHAGLRADRPDEAASTVRRYLQTAQAVLASGSVKPQRVSQDGRGCLLSVRSGHLHASLLVGPTGVISIDELAASPTAAPAASSSSSSFPSAQESRS